jgi:uncharacterized protein (TIGR02117 family)
MLVLAASCASAPPQPQPDPGGDSAASTATLYVIHRGWHTDVGFPTSELHGPLAALEHDFPGASYLVIGFGERHYVLSRDKNFGEMLAALWPGPGLILVTGLKATPEEAFGAARTARLRLTPAQADAVAGFVWGVLQPDPRGAVTPYAPGPYAGSLFYASSARYSALHTCNTWTAEALQAGGLPVRSDGVIFSHQVWEQAHALAATAHGSALPAAAAGR